MDFFPSVHYTGLVSQLPSRQARRHPSMEFKKPSTQLYEMAVQRVRDYAIFLLDAEGRVISWNAGAQALKGYEPEDIIGKHFSIFYPQEAKNREWPQRELEM